MHNGGSDTGIFACRGCTIFRLSALQDHRMSAGTHRWWPRWLRERTRIPDSLIDLTNEDDADVAPVTAAQVWDALAVCCDSVLFTESTVVQGVSCAGLLQRVRACVNTTNRAC